MSIIIGADFVPTKANIESLSSGNIGDVIGEELIELFKDADYSILNLECPLCDKNTPISKGGHNMSAPTACVYGLRKLGVKLVTLANNHILDQGEQGLNTTCRALEENGIFHVGAGENLKEAQKAYYFVVNDVKFGVYACAEHEFSIASNNSPGANPVDALEITDHIAKTKLQCDYLIVLYHGGKELFQYPSPKLQKICRKLVDKGANLVLCQHSHCIGCMEKYNNGMIVYGQGNFLFDGCNNKLYKEGLMIVIRDDLTIDFVPIELKQGRLEVVSDKNKILIEEFYYRSKEIATNGFIKTNYDRFSRKAVGLYLLEFQGNPITIFFFRVLNKLSGQRFKNNFQIKINSNSRHLCQVRNYIECETHRELILNALGSKSDS